MKGLSVVQRLQRIHPRESVVRLLEMRIMELRILWDSERLTVKGKPERDILRLNEQLLDMITARGEHDERWQ